MTFDPEKKILQATALISTLSALIKFLSGGLAAF